MILSLMLLSLIIAFVVVHFNKVYELTYVTEATYSDGTVYGLDSTDSNYFVFKYDVDTQEGVGIDVPFVRGTVAETISGPYLIDGKGCYVYRTVIDIEDVENEENNYSAIAYCDYENGELLDIVCWDNDSSEEFFYQVNAVDDKLYFIMYCADNNALRYYEFDGKELDYCGEVEYKSGMAMYFVDQYLNAWSCSYEGDIYCQTLDGVNELVFENDGTQISRVNTNFVDGKGVYFTNLDNNTVYELTYVDGVFSMTELDFEHMVYDYEINEYNVQNYNEEENVYLALVDVEEKVLISLISEEGESIIEYIHKDKSTMRMMRLEVFLGVFIAFMGIWLLMLKYAKDKTGIPVFILILCILIPMNVIGCYYSIQLTQDNLNQQKMIQIASQLSNIADVCQNEINMEIFEENSSKEYVTEQDIVKQFEEFTTESEYYDAEKGTYNAFNTIVAVNVYYYKNDEIYSASLSNILNIPLSYNSYIGASDSIITALEENKEVVLDYKMFGMDVLSVIKPILNSSGDVVGGIEIVLNYDTTFEAHQIYNNRIAAIYIMCSILFTLIVTFIIYLATRGLKKTRIAAKQIMDGNLSVRIHSKGNNEIGELNRSLDVMIEELESKTIFMKEQAKNYEAMMDSALFQMMHREGVLASQEGDNTQINKLIFSIGFVQEGAFSFQKFNQEIAPHMEFIAEKNLGIVQISKEKLKITVLDNNQVINVAISIQELLRLEHNERYISIIRQSSKIGIVGEKERKKMVTISLDEEFRVIMQEFAHKYKIPIVISGEASAFVENIFTRYQVRTLGYIKVGYANKLEVIYEILDGNQQQDLRLKINTKDIFEEGVKLFMSGKIMQAMKKFIQVLTHNPKDLVAQEYILLCEDRLGHGDNQELYLMKCD